MRSMLPRKVASVFVRAPIICAPLPQEGAGPSQVATVNPQPAHLFMICSNIKLTSPTESIVSGDYDFHE
jgi:hypothetical protein